MPATGFPSLFLMKRSDWMRYEIHGSCDCVDTMPELSECRTVSARVLTLNHSHCGSAHKLCVAVHYCFEHAVSVKQD